MLITDLYDSDELMDESEALAHACSPMNWDDPLTVETMTAEEAKERVMARRGELSLWDAYQRDASKAQKAIVAKKAKAYDRERIVVLDGIDIIDGNHHVIAAILTNNPVLYVDLTEWP
ncbi:MAG: hypothetical protein EOO77_23835 [Oxalobacteraceae bacterium]|nr:MAG: hypothetical protein EOO77_23835 [Oxalobacteraceae bacterium]